jgi:hypothetical protein
VHGDWEGGLIQADTSGLRERIRQTLRLFSVAETQAYALATYFLTIIRARTSKKTGKTSVSWTIHYHKVQDGVVWEISPDGRENEVTYLEFGTKPHVIEARGGALKFEVGGETVYATRVFHPGTKPLGFVRLTQEDLDKSAKEIGERLLQNIRHVWA